jgi:hypothetical protein
MKSTMMINSYVKKNHKNVTFIISIVFIPEAENTIAFGGVATGSINA